MSAEQDEIHAQANENVAPLPPPDVENHPEKSSRRELIERYGRYAVVAAPLLMFVSKAHAIHSRP